MVKLAKTNVNYSKEKCSIKDITNGADGQHIAINIMYCQVFLACIYNHASTYKYSWLLLIWHWYDIYLVSTRMAAAHGLVRAPARSRVWVPSSATLRLELLLLNTISQGLLPRLVSFWEPGCSPVAGHAVAHPATRVWIPWRSNSGFSPFCLMKIQWASFHWTRFF
jgi:hypothetical protein